MAHHVIFRCRVSFYKQQRCLGCPEVTSLLLQSLLLLPLSLAMAICLSVSTICTFKTQSQNVKWKLLLAQTVQSKLDFGKFDFEEIPRQELICGQNFRLSQAGRSHAMGDFGQIKWLSWKVTLTGKVLKGKNRLCQDFPTHSRPIFGAFSPFSSFLWWKSSCFKSHLTKAPKRSGRRSEFIDVSLELATYFSAKTARLWG